jgi:hypothetical protein
MRQELGDATGRVAVHPDQDVGEVLDGIDGCT